MPTSVEVKFGMVLRGLHLIRAMLMMKFHLAADPRLEVDQEADLPIGAHFLLGADL